MSKLKILFLQVLMISTGILFVIGINGIVSHFIGGSFDFEWYYPFSIILLGVLSALPTSIFILNDDRKNRNFIVNLILHCLSIWIITIIIGGIFNWYSTSTFGGVIYITIAYFVVYIFVWVVTRWILRIEDKKINQALKDIQDDE